MTKKDFKAECDTDHVFGRGRNKVNAIYLDWKSDEFGRGFKYGVAAEIENCTKAELLDHMYNWIEKGIYLPYYIYSRFAQYDKQRFKCPITFNYKTWN
jgi:hypothetical protein